jgi:predicted DNA-binding transcriptional regulator YafY
LSRSARLLRLLQHLRAEPAPVTAARLAERTGVSARAIYRDIAALHAAGALIDGQSGYGYTLEEDPTLPPQMLTRLEMEAVILGLSAVQAEGDAELTAAAGEALAKITASLPERARAHAHHAVLRAVRVERKPDLAIDPAAVRRAMWEERALDIRYADGDGRATERRIWPLSVVFYERALIVLAHCRLRDDFRSFRLDRIAALAETGESFRPRRAALLREYLRREARADCAAGRAHADSICQDGSAIPSGR